MVRLTGRRQKHVLDIHKAKEGQELIVGLENDKIGTGRIKHLTNRTLEMDIFLTKNPPPKNNIRLILALPRPPVLKRSLQAAVSLGIKEIFLIQTNRVEKSFWQSTALDKKSLYEQCVLGLEQSGDTIFPQIIMKKRFKPFVEDELPEVIKGSKAFVAHPDAKTPCPAIINKAVTIIIGPEGGFIPYEIEKLCAVGVKPVHFGDRILKVETALIAILSRFYK